MYERELERDKELYSENVCVLVRERERGRKRKRKRDRERNVWEEFSM